VRRSRTGRRTARLRLVLYFNPQMCVEQRTTAEAHRQSVEDLLADINRRLRAKNARMDAHGARFPWGSKGWFCCSFFQVRGRWTGTAPTKNAHDWVRGRSFG
jgi:hypothetical protein